MSEYGHMTKTTFFLMFGVAAFVDIIGILLTLVGIGLVADSIVNPIAYFGFWLWCAMKGIKLLAKKNIKAVAVTFVLELIPVINLLPAMTFMIVRTYINNKMPVAPNIVDDVKKGNTGGMASNIHKGAVAGTGVAKSVGANSGDIKGTA